MVGTSEFGRTCRQKTMLSGMPRARAAVATSDFRASIIAARRLRVSTAESDSAIGQARQHQMRELVAERLAVAGDRQDAELDAEQDDQHQRQPERRKADAEGRDDAHRMIGAAGPGCAPRSPPSARRSGATARRWTAPAPASARCGWRSASARRSCRGSIVPISPLREVFAGSRNTAATSARRGRTGRGYWRSPSGVARVPSIMRAGSPGISRTRMKVMTLMPKSTGRNCSGRNRTNL